MNIEIRNVGGIWYICAGGHAKRLGHDHLTPEELAAMDEFIRDYKEYLKRIES